jgi:hypothetical protein
MFDQILKALSGGNFGDIEKNAGDLLGRLEKLGADVIGSNGNVLTAVVSLAEDFATMKAAISDVVTVVSDLKAIVEAAKSTAPAAAPVPAASPVPAAPAFSLDAALSAVSQLAHVVSGNDPFAAKPLARAASVMEPKGGA